MQCELTTVACHQAVTTSATMHTKQLSGSN